MKSPSAYSTKHKDTGCEFARACLNCPFPKCMEVELRVQRRVQIKLMACEGKSPETIASELNVSVSFVKRMLASHHAPYVAIEMLRQEGKIQKTIATELGVSLRTVQRRLVDKRNIERVINGERT